MANQKRNEKCNCGSGKKFKHCCLTNENNNVYSFANVLTQPKKEVDTTSNEKVLEKLNNPTEYGFNKIFEMKVFGNKTYSIYEPIFTENDGPTAKQWIKRMDTDKWGDTQMHNQLTVYCDSLGTVESMAYNFYQDLEDTALEYYKNNMGSEPFKAFENSDYRLNLLVIQSGKKVLSIHPLFDASWSKKHHDFESAYGDKYSLPHLLSLVARSVMSFLPISGFNPNAKEIVSNRLKVSNTDRIIQNWCGTYNACYELKLALAESRKNFTTHTKSDVMKFWRVLD